MLVPAFCHKTALLPALLLLTPFPPSHHSSKRPGNRQARLHAFLPGFIEVERLPGAGILHKRLWAAELCQEYKRIVKIPGAASPVEAQEHGGQEFGIRVGNKKEKRRQQHGKNHKRRKHGN